MIHDPYCSNCKYNLSGLTESSKCPECGQPLVEVLTRKGFDPQAWGWGRHYTSQATLFGLPVVQIAIGPTAASRRGKAKAIIAIGDQAYGLLACGGLAVGLVAFGGLSIGLLGLGGCAIGVFAVGGWAMGGFAAGGGAMGLIAVGGGAIGIIASAGGFVARYGAGGGGSATYMLTAYRRDPEAVDLFSRLDWLLGGGTAGSGMLTPLGWLALLLFGLVALIGMLAGYAYLRHPD